MRNPLFTILLVMTCLMVIGVALIPWIDVAEAPRPLQGKTLSVSFSWPNASAKVVEQNVTSRIEGIVSSVKGVEKVASVSYFGSGIVQVQLKKSASVPVVKFEISSLLRQVYPKLPKGVSYPILQGGEIAVEGQHRRDTNLRLLSYQINSSRSDGQLKEYVEQHLARQLKQMEGVTRVEVSGGVRKYIEISYDPFVLSGYGLHASDIESAIKSYMGRMDIVGELLHDGRKDGKERLALYLSVDRFDKPLEQMPIGRVRDKVVYLNDLATYEYKERTPEHYFRVNGLNTIYLNIMVDADTNRIRLSQHIRERMAELEKHLSKGVYLKLLHDETEKAATELNKLVRRSLLSLAMLLVFVWVVRRDWKYLLLMSLALLSNLCCALIAYRFFDIRLHIFSLAGITVSLGMIIDAAVVMTDHYSYYRNRRAFLSILAALLTTIASLIIVLWLPDFLKKDLYDFSWIIIINLTVALLVAWFFIPAMVEQLEYHSRQQGGIRHKSVILAWTRFYRNYIRKIQGCKWIVVLLLILTFGLPVHLLPYPYDEYKKLTWCQKVYNATLGSTFFQRTLREPLSVYLGGSLRLFNKVLQQGEQDGTVRERTLNIRAALPPGGSISDLNQKVMILENYLATIPGIKEFETDVWGRGANVKVSFKEEYRDTSYPEMVENGVIGKVITIGGADWSTSGISEMGFSNSLHLQDRYYHLKLSGFNFDHLYRYAEEMRAKMNRNPRVRDLYITATESFYPEPEFFMHYDWEQMTLHDVNPSQVFHALDETISEREIERYRDTNFSVDMRMRPLQRDRFDIWHINNVQLDVGGRNLRLSDFMNIEQRMIKNYIPKENQEFVLSVDFNLLGSDSYCGAYIKQLLKETNDMLPLGYRCRNSSYWEHQGAGTEYGLLILIVVIIYLICAILFESLRLPFVIILLIPVSFVGTFLTYYLTGLTFGSGGYASMVLLSGLTVNAAIYILAEYRYLHDYVKAYNHKIVAVLLTVFSTILGLVPFLIDGDVKSFWYSFAVGTIGGLLFSLIALIFVLPVFLKPQCRS